MLPPSLLLLLLFLLSPKSLTSLVCTCACIVRSLPFRRDTVWRCTRILEIYGLFWLVYGRSIITITLIEARTQFFVLGVDWIEHINFTCIYAVAIVFQLPEGRKSHSFDAVIFIFMGLRHWNHAIRALQIAQSMHNSQTYLSQSTNFYSYWTWTVFSLSPPKNPIFNTFLLTHQNTLLKRNNANV